MDSVALYFALAVIVFVVALLVVVALVRGRGKGEQPPSVTTGVRHLTLTRAPGSLRRQREASSRTRLTRTMMGRPLRPLNGRKQQPGDWFACARGWPGSNKLGQGLLALLSRGDLNEDTWDEIEETLLTSDLGVGPTTELMNELRTEVKIQGNSDPATVRQYLRNDLLGLVDPTLDRSLATARNVGLDVPAVVMVVGVNGTGKTTTTGKLARLLVAADEDVVMGAADTFRAAAAEQLTTWGERVGVPVVRGPEGSDPASVAFEAVTVSIDGDCDVVLIDTAGRLHTKVGLMDELGKVKRVIEKKAPVSEVLLVLTQQRARTVWFRRRCSRKPLTSPG